MFGPRLRRSAVLLAVLGAASTARAGGALSFTLSIDSLDAWYWAPTDKPTGVGVHYAAASPKSPAVLEVGMQLSFDSGSFWDPGLGLVNGELDMVEFYGGVRGEFQRAPNDPEYFFFSAGLSVVSVDLTVSDSGGGSASAGDATGGLYVSFGSGYRQQQMDMYAALRLRIATDVTMWGVPGDVDGFALVLGFGRSW